MEATIFETHYKEYCRQIAELDFLSIKDTLGIELRGRDAVIPFLDKDYIVSDTGIADESGNRPNLQTLIFLTVIRNDPL